MKRIISIVFALIIGLTMGKLLVMALTPPILPIGAKAPQFEYKNAHGEKVIFQSHDFDIVMFFNTGCEHCVYQLELLNDNLDAFAQAQLYLLTSNEKVDEFSKWKHLNASERVTWGTVSLETIKTNFGKPATPSFYIFRNRQLKTKFYGEVKLERLLGMLKK
jgi:hypothetical protein